MSSEYGYKPDIMQQLVEDLRAYAENEDKNVEVAYNLAARLQDILEKCDQHVVDVYIAATKQLCVILNHLLCLIDQGEIDIVKGLMDQHISDLVSALPTEEFPVEAPTELSAESRRIMQKLNMLRIERKNLLKEFIDSCDPRNIHSTCQ